MAPFGGIHRSDQNCIDAEVCDWLPLCQASCAHQIALGSIAVKRFADLLEQRLIARDFQYDKTMQGQAALIEFCR